MSAFWRGFLSVFMFGYQPCWLFGHDTVIDWGFYPSAPKHEPERTRWSFETQVWYGPLRHRCVRCGEVVD